MGTCTETDNIILKTGSSTEFILTYSHEGVNEEGEFVLVPQDLTGYEIFVDFIHRVSGEPVANTSLGNGVELTENTGEYVVRAGDSLEWPLGKYFVDILYVNTGKGRHTTDFILDVIQGKSQQE